MNTKHIRTIRILERVQWLCLGSATAIVVGCGSLTVLAYFAAAGVGLIEW